MRGADFMQILNSFYPSTSTLKAYTIDLVHKRTIFSRQASLARQAFLITPLHGARLKTGKNAYAKK